MTYESGSRLGRYVIKRQLGSGGMGEVYLAEDQQLERTVALKFLPADFANDKERMRRFVLEAKAAAALNHPNIAHIYEIGEVNGTNFIAMECVDGKTLRHLMRESMTVGNILDLAIQVASALVAAHASGVIHRDIKPENIVVRPDGYAKVLDFGLAKLTEKRGGTSESSTIVNTDPGVVMGTARYMSPEQARGLTVDERTDIFSLGVVIYEMAAGRPPFEATTGSDTIALILNKEPPPLARFSREVPAELERIVLKALAKNCEERYQSVKDLLIDLKHLKEELEFEIKLERSSSPDIGHVPTILSTGARLAQVTGAQGAQSTAETSTPVAKIDQPATRLFGATNVFKRISFAKAALALILLGGSAATGLWIWNRFSTSGQSTAQQILPNLEAARRAKWVQIPAGTFQQGCVPADKCLENELPRRTVRLTRDYWIMAYNVTVSDFESFSRDTGRQMPDQPPWSEPNHPVVNVNWFTASDFCKWYGGRLPTEAEWERAARGGVEGRIFPWGHSASHDFANYGTEEGNMGLAAGRDQWVQTSPVGSFPPNSFGVFDMAGNVYEWCADWYHDNYYSQAPNEDPKGPETGLLRVLRGGCWTFNYLIMRSSHRDNGYPINLNPYVGIRCARDSSP